MEENVKKFTMKDVSDLILSDDYTKRLQGEYVELVIRTQKLEDMCVRYNANTLDFNPTCSIELLEGQLNAMRQYLYLLKIRFAIEGIDIPKVEL